MGIDNTIEAHYPITSILMNASVAPSPINIVLPGSDHFRMNYILAVGGAVEEFTLSGACLERVDRGEV